MEKICFHLSRNDDSNSLNTCSPGLQNWAETDSSEKAEGNSCTVDADVSNRNRFLSLRGRRLKRKGKGVLEARE